MFKKQCKKCQSKIKKDFDFCPYCGRSFEEKQDWGMLGKNDFIEDQNQFQPNFLGGITGNMLNKMLGSAMKMLEKELQKEVKRPNNPLYQSNFRLMINGKEVPLHQTQKQKPKKILPKTFPIFSLEKQKKFSTLPKQEPQTNIRRLANKVIYEINMPEVKSIQDISIMKLESSIEIKALSKNIAYEKIIPISLPLINYKLERENLVLELVGR